MLSRFLSALIASACLLVASVALAGFDYDEYVSGDLSDLGTAPTLLAPEAGENYLAGSVGNFDEDDDFFTFTVPADWVLASLELTYYSSSTNHTFLGIEDAGTYVTGQANENYFGYVSFGEEHIGTNLLTEMGTSNGNFTPPLGAGDYSFWLDEGGTREDYEFTFTFGQFGDLNCDGSLNSLDIDAFVTALGSTPPDYQDYYNDYPGCVATLADINGDGSINSLDIDPFVQLLTGG